MKLKKRILIPCAVLLASGLLQAQAPSSDSENTGTFSTVFSGSQTFAGDVELDGVKSGGELETSSFEWNGTYEQPFGDAWSFQVGVGYEYLNLDYDQAASPLPETLSGLALELGARWRFNDSWVFSASIAPGLYGDDEVDSSDAFTMPAKLLATWVGSDRFAVTFGVRVSPFSDSEVMPIVNVRWDINPQWTVVLGLPRTEARYRVNERLTVFGGVGAFGGSYAVDDPSSGSSR